MSKEVVNKSAEEMQREAEIKRENKKAIGVFAVLMVISGIIGGFLGFFGVQTEPEELTPAVARFFTNGLGTIAPFLLILSFIVVAVYCKIVFDKCKKRWDAEKDTNEEVYEEVDKTLGGVLAVVSVYTVVSYFLFSCTFYQTLYAKENKIFAGIMFLIALFVFIIDIFFVMKYQVKVIDFCKMMNPEKKGSAYDVNFQKKWIDSCDEAEKQMIYQCGFAAYKTTSILCLILWVVFTMLAMFLEISLWPVVIVSLIWLVLTVSYIMEERKLMK